MNNRFPKQRRVSSSGDIRQVLKNGDSIAHAGVFLMYAPNSGPVDRMGVLVSRRHGNAVVRNGIKRRVREAYRTQQRSGPPCFDILIRPSVRAVITQKEITTLVKKWKNRVSG